MVVHDVAVLVAHADGDGLVVAARREDLAQGAADVGVGGAGGGARRQRGEGGEAGEEREQAGGGTHDATGLPGRAAGNGQPRMVMVTDWRPQACACESSGNHTSMVLPMMAEPVSPATHVP